MTVSLSQNQKLFAAALSQSTGLDPNTVKAWMIAEEPAGAQSGYKGTQDWLNVGITDSGPQGAGNSVWQDPVAAGKATANWIKGTWSDPGFGSASPGIQSILKTVGQSPAQQLAAIAGSGWASSGYGGAAKLQSLLGQVTGEQLPTVSTGGGGSTGGTIPLPTFSATSATAPAGPNVFDTLANLEAARERVVGITGTDSLQSGWQAMSDLVKGQQQAKQNSLVGSQPSATNNETPVVQQAITDGSKAGPGAQKILNMALSAIGGPYSQNNHASAFTESASQIRRTGTDCSGFISWLMGPDGLGIWQNALATPAIPNAPGIQKGTGKNITLWNNPLPGNSGHVFIQIGNRYFQSAGGGAGIQEISGSTAKSMIRSGDNGAPYYPLHPQGY